MLTADRAERLGRHQHRLVAQGAADEEAAQQRTGRRAGVVARRAPATSGASWPSRREDRLGDRGEVALAAAEQAELDGRGQRVDVRRRGRRPPRRPAAWRPRRRGRRRGRRRAGAGPRASRCRRRRTTGRDRRRRARGVRRPRRGSRPAWWSRLSSCWQPVPDAATMPIRPGRTALAKPSPTPSMTAVPQSGPMTSAPREAAYVLSATSSATGTLSLKIITSWPASSASIASTVALAPGTETSTSASGAAAAQRRAGRPRRRDGRVAGGRPGRDEGGVDRREGGRHVGVVVEAERDDHVVGGGVGHGEAHALEHLEVEAGGHRHLRRHHARARPGRPGSPAAASPSRRTRRCGARRGPCHGVVMLPSRAVDGWSGRRRRRGASEAPVRSPAPEVAPTASSASRVSAARVGQPVARAGGAPRRAGRSRGAWRTAGW